MSHRPLSRPSVPTRPPSPEARLPLRISVIRSTRQTSITSERTSTFPTVRRGTPFPVDSLTPSRGRRRYTCRPGPDHGPTGRHPRPRRRARRRTVARRPRPPVSCRDSGEDPGLTRYGVDVPEKHARPGPDYGRSPNLTLTGGPRLVSTPYSKPSGDPTPLDMSVPVSFRGLSRRDVWAGSEHLSD